MKIITKIVVTISVLIVLSIFLISVIATISMNDIEEETKRRSAQILEDKEKRKMVDIAVQKGNFTSSILDDMLSYTKIIGDTVEDYDNSFNYIDSNSSFHNRSFVIDGYLSTQLESMTNVMSNGNIDGVVGSGNPKVYFSGGSSATGNWTYISGSIRANCDIQIKVPSNTIIEGTVNNETLEIEGKTITIKGYTDIMIGGDCEKKDPGILVRGTITGNANIRMTGPFSGILDGSVDGMFFGDMDGRIKGMISHLPDYLDGLLKNIDASSDRIDSIYFGGVDPTLSQNEEQTTFIGPSIGYHGYNASKRDWFLEAVESRDIAISKPYIDATGLGLMITVSYPVYTNGELVGVVGADVTIQSMIDSIFKDTSYDTMKTYLIDEESRLIATEDLEFNGNWTDDVKTDQYLDTKNRKFQMVLDSLSMGLSGVVELNIIDNGTEKDLFNHGPTITEGEKVLAYSPINRSGWGLVISVERDEIVSPSNQISSVIDDKVADIATRFMIITIAIIILGVFIGALVSVEIIKPLEDLTDSVKSTGSGGSHENFGSVKRKDEIGELSRAFSDMNSRIMDNNKNLEKEIKERKKKEDESKLQRKRAEFYLDLLSHDIGNLHQGISSSIAIARDDITKPEMKKVTLDLAQQSVHRSIALIRNILLLSRVKRSSPDLVEIDLVGSIEKAMTQVRSMFPSKEIDFRMYVHDEDTTIMAEPILEQLFLNLLHNSVKFQTGNLAIIVVEVVKGIDDSTTVKISDRGTGIPDKSKHNIFGRFESSGHEDKEGSGLGLHLVKELVDRYSATIQVKDRIDGDHTKGAMFVLKFNKK